MRSSNPTAQARAEVSSSSLGHQELVKNTTGGDVRSSHTDLRARVNMRNFNHFLEAKQLKPLPKQMVSSLYIYIFLFISTTICLEVSSTP